MSNIIGICPNKAITSSSNKKLSKGQFKKHRILYEYLFEKDINLFQNYFRKFSKFSKSIKFHQRKQKLAYAWFRDLPLHRFAQSHRKRGALRMAIASG